MDGHVRVEDAAQGSFSSPAALPPRRAFDWAAQHNSDCPVCGPAKTRTTRRAAELALSTAKGCEFAIEITPTATRAVTMGAIADGREAVTKNAGILTGREAGANRPRD